MIRNLLILTEKLAKLHEGNGIRNPLNLTAVEKRLIERLRQGVIADILDRLIDKVVIFRRGLTIVEAVDRFLDPGLIKCNVAGKFI